MNHDYLSHPSTFSQTVTETVTIHGKTNKIGVTQRMNEDIWGITCRDLSSNKIFSNRACNEVLDK